MIDEAAKYAEEDKRVHDFVTSKNEYESILHQSKQTVDEVKKKSSENPALFNETEMSKVAELEKYSDDPDLATYSIDSVDSLKGKLESLKGVLATVQTYLYQKNMGTGAAPDDSGDTQQCSPPFDPKNFDPSKMSEYMSQMGLDPSKLGDLMKEAQEETKGTVNDLD